MTPSSIGMLIGESLGGYQLKALLGAGGMAEVYRAQDASLKREVAVKVLPSSLAADPGYVQRFRAEGRSVAALSHPNIVPIYQFGEERGLLFLVMPILRESLRDRMERERRLPIPEATRIVAQIASALDAAHNIGLVHRDVKPENILLDEDGNALLTDFGIAREASFLRQTGTNRTLAATGLPVGTPEYMAPEQLRANIVDQRADIYALGAVLYELLTGVVPHEAATPYEVAALVLTERPKPPAQRNPNVWPELEAVVMTALAADAAQRYPNARAFALALRRAVLPQDASIARLTMPAGSSESFDALPDSSFGITDELPFGAESDATTAIRPIAQGAPTTLSEAERLRDWRQRVQARTPRGRALLIVSAVAVLLLVGVCGGSSLAILQSLSLPGGVTSPFASSGESGAPTATAAQVNSPQPTPSPTSSPTPTSVPSPTAIPRMLILAPSTFSLNSYAKRACAGTISIANTSSQTITWNWTQTSPTLPTGPSAYQFQVNGSHLSTQLPHNVTVQPGAQSTITAFKQSACSGQTYTVTMTDSLGSTYTFTMREQG